MKKFLFSKPVCFVFFVLLVVNYSLHAQKPILLKTGVADSTLLDYKTIGDTCFFKVKQGNFFQLWKTDGTTAGTVLVKDSFVSEIGNFVSINNTLYFFGPNQFGKPALYKSNGTKLGTVVVRNFSADSSILLGLSVINNVGYFSYMHGNPHYEGIWKTYGDSAGTTEIKAGILVKKTFQNKAFFKAGTTPIIFMVNNPGSSYAAIWKTDGTLAGTMKLKDSAFLYSISKIGGLVQTTTCTIFTDYAGASNLWRSDGTVAGTYILRGGSINNLTLYNNNAYFLSGAIYKALNKTDGTSTGAVLGLSNVGNSLGVLGTKLFLGGKDNNDWEPYAGDGTPANTSLLRDIHLGADAGGSDPKYYTALNNTMFFIANDNLHGDQIYRSNATIAGTTLAYALADTIPGFNTKGLSASGSYLLFVSNNNALYVLRPTVNPAGLFGSNQMPMLKVFPNPTNSILYIDYPASQNTFIQLHSYLGQEILAVPFTNKLDLSVLSKGIYFLTLTDKDKKYTQKIIVD